MSADGGYVLSLCDFLMNRNIDDDLLFHYTGADTAFSKILFENKIRFSPFKKMNDPMEFLPPICMLSSDCSVPRSVIDERLSEIESASHARINRVFSLSFSKDCFPQNQNAFGYLHYKGWARSRMWAQYSKSHTGVCIIFSQSKLASCIERTISRDFEKIQFEHSRIRYSNDIRVFERDMTANVTDQNAHESLSNFFLERKTHYLFQKIEDFRDEQEYRFVLVDKSAASGRDFYYFDYEDAILGVIVGCAFDHTYDPMLEHFFKTKKLPVLYADWSYGVPRLS